MNSDTQSHTDSFCIRSSGAKNKLFMEAQQLGDRNGHRIGLDCGDDSHILLTSFEGNDTEVWPPSPPLQQVYQQTVDDDPVILAVGMAGKNHYSMSARISESPKRVVLKIEMACLIKQADNDIVDQTTRFLGTTYLPNSAMAVHGDAQGFWLSGSDPDAKLATIHCSDSTVCEVDSDGRMKFSPVKLATGEPTQWSYSIAATI